MDSAQAPNIDGCKIHLNVLRLVPHKICFLYGSQCSKQLPDGNEVLKLYPTPNENCIKKVIAVWWLASEILTNLNPGKTRTVEKYCQNQQTAPESATVKSFSFGFTETFCSTLSNLQQNLCISTMLLKSGKG